MSARGALPWTTGTSPQPPVAPLYTAAVAPFYSAVDTLKISSRASPKKYSPAPSGKSSLSRSSAVIMKSHIIATYALLIKFSLSMSTTDLMVSHTMSMPGSMTTARLSICSVNTPITLGSGWSMTTGHHELSS